MIHTKFLTWSGIRSAIPAHLKTLNVEESGRTSLEFQCGEKIFDPEKCKSKQFYTLLISKKTMVSRGFTKLKEDFDLDDMTVCKAFINLKTVSSETFIRSLQFKFLDDIIYTYVRLAIIGYVPKDTCTFCDVDSETVLHLLYECPFTNRFLKKFEDFWFALSNEHEKLFIGKLGKSDLLNYFMILAKLHIWSSRHCTKSPSFDVFKEIVDIKYRTEKYIAFKFNM